MPAPVHHSMKQQAEIRRKYQTSRKRSMSRRTRMDGHVRAVQDVSQLHGVCSPHANKTPEVRYGFCSYISVYIACLKQYHNGPYTTQTDPTPAVQWHQLPQIPAGAHRTLSFFCFWKDFSLDVHANRVFNWCLVFLLDFLLLSSLRSLLVVEWLAAKGTGVFVE